MVVVVSDGGSGVFTVDVTVVEPAPILSYNPVSYDFGSMLEGETDSTSFDIWNSGTETLTYSLSESCSWVSISPTDGDSTGEHDSISVDISTSGLSVGAYSCDIGISSDGGSGIFRVFLTVISGGSENLDQEQDQSNNNYLVYNSRWLGQSFKPSLDTLSKVLTGLSLILMILMLLLGIHIIL